jgi:hypothetical protein
MKLSLQYITFHQETLAKKTILLKLYHGRDGNMEVYSVEIQSEDVKCMTIREQCPVSTFHRVGDEP